MLPPRNQSRMRASTLTGSPKKNGGSTSQAVSRCQAANTATSSASCAPRSPALDSLALRIGSQDLLLHGAPDRGVDFEKARLETNFCDIAGPRQVDRVVADGAGAGPGREHDDSIGQRDCFLQIVRDE